MKIYVSVHLETFKLKKKRKKEKKIGTKKKGFKWQAR